MSTPYSKAFITSTDLKSLQLDNSLVRSKSSGISFLRTAAGYILSICSCIAQTFWLARLKRSLSTRELSCVQVVLQVVILLAPLNDSNVALWSVDCCIAGGEFK